MNKLLTNIVSWSIISILTAIILGLGLCLVAFVWKGAVELWTVIL